MLSRRGTAARRAVPGWAAAAALAIGIAGGTAQAGEGAPVPLRIHGYFQTLLREEGSRGVQFNQNNMNDGSFSQFRLFLKAESALSDRVSVFTRMKFDSEASFEVNLDSAYLMFSRLGPEGLHVELGKVPSPFGAFAERSYPDRNPLVGIPLMYFYHSGLRSDLLPMSAEDLLAVRGQGQFGAVYPSASGSGAAGRRGLPVIYDPCWDFGLVLLGSRGIFEGRLGLMNGAPASPETKAEANGSRTPIARLGLAPAAWLRAGASVARGAYLAASVEPSLPDGKSLADYRQTALGADLELTRGWWDLHFEFVRNEFESPWIAGPLESDSWYLEVRRKFAAGLYAAARWDAVDFGTIVDSGGAAREWDLDTERLEFGAGYWLERRALLKAVVQLHRQEGTWKSQDRVGGVQASLWF